MADPSDLDVQRVFRRLGGQPRPRIRGRLSLFTDESKYYPGTFLLLRSFEVPVNEPSGSDGEADELDQGTIIYDGGFSDAPTFNNNGNGKKAAGTTTDFAKFLFSIGVPQAGYTYTMTYDPAFSGLSQGGALAMVGFGFKQNNSYHFAGLKGDGSTGLNANKAYGPNFKKLQATTEVDGGASAHGTQAGPNWLRISIAADGSTYTLSTSSDGTTWTEEFTAAVPTPLSEATDASDFGIAIYLDAADKGAFEVDITLWEQAAASEASLDDFLANDGATGPIASVATYPTAFYDSEENTTWVAYEGWTGHQRIGRIFPYRHATGLIGEYRAVRLQVMTDDEHGVPAIAKDHEDYLYMAHDAHGSPMYLNSTKSPVTGGANPAWRTIHTTSGNHTYPKLCTVGTTFYMMMRGELSGDQRIFEMLYGTPSGGEITWSEAIQTLVDYGANTRAYMGNVVVRGTDIHFVGTREDLGSSPAPRKDIYHYVLDTTSGDISNYAGTTTIAKASLPVDLTEANSDFRVYAVGTDNCDIPCLAFDTDGNPHYFFALGTGTDFQFVHMMHDGSSFTATTDIAPVTGSLSTGAVGSPPIIPLATGAMAFHYSDNSAGYYRGASGVWKMRTRSAAGVLSSETTLLTPGAAKLSIAAPLDGHANFRALGTEIAASDSDADAGGLRLYGYGDSGMLGPATMVIDSDAQTVIDGFSVEPTALRKMLINDLMVNLKSSTLWAKIDALYIMAAHDAQAARVNWKSPGTYDLTLHGTADPTFFEDSRLVTDGVDNYINSNFNPVTAGGNFAQNSCCFGFWGTTPGASNASVAGRWDGSDGVTIAPRNTADNLVGRLNAASAATFGAVATGAGMTMLNRANSTDVAAYKDGVAVSGQSSTSTALNSASLLFGSINEISSALYGFRAGVIGGALTADEHSDLYVILRTYLKAIGAES